MSWHDSAMFKALADAVDPSTRFGGALYGSGVMAALLRAEPIMRRVVYGVVSVPTAYYSAQILSHYLSDAPGVQGVYGFVSGVFALRILQRLFEAAERVDGDTLWGKILDRVLGPVRHREPPK